MLALRTWDFDLQLSLGNDISKIWMGVFISEEERALDELLRAKSPLRVTLIKI